MKNKRYLTLLEVLGIAFVVAVIAVGVMNIRSCSFSRTTAGDGAHSQTTVETTSAQQ